MIERLAEGGKPVAALRAATRVARDLLEDGPSRAAVFEEVPKDERGRDPFYAALGKVVAVLKDRGTRFRAVPGLVDAVESIARLHVSLAMLAGDLADVVEARRAAASARDEDRPAPAPLHVEAVVHLSELGVGLPLPWKWDELAGAYDDAVVPLDPEGRQQVQAAATVLAGLVAPGEQEHLKEFNERRRIVPVASLRNVGSILGPSAGLPTFLAMVAARFGLMPRRGVAATGALDGATIPPLPAADRFEPAVYDRFLAVSVTKVEAVREKVQAVIEQCPDVETFLLPAAGRAEVEADEALGRDLETAGIRIVWVERIADALAADLFTPLLALRPLRIAGSADERRAAAALEAIRLARLGAGFGGFSS